MMDGGMMSINRMDSMDSMGSMMSSGQGGSSQNNAPVFVRKLE